MSRFPWTIFSYTKKDLTRAAHKRTKFFIILEIRPDVLSQLFTSQA